MRKLFAVLSIGFCLMVAAPSLAEITSRNVTIYKNPQCECCEAYADYLRGSGFTVTVKETYNLVDMSLKAGIPEDFQGCHLGFIDGYLISGHVPINTVNRLLTEQPKIKGVTLPGMPDGSPGMSGVKTEPFKIYEIGAAISRIYAVE
ncbi:MAG: DUF411 domain-containing protein [Alphaproteobacteria bacterium]|nr:DUF411 domain-containing protein [Alphaproteobacteria bacterium]